MHFLPLLSALCLIPRSGDLQILYRLPGHVPRILVTLPLDLVYESAIVQPIVLDDLLYAILVFAVVVVFLIFVLVILLRRFCSFLVQAGGDLVGDIVFAAGFVIGDGGYSITCQLNKVSTYRDGLYVCSEK